MKKDEYDYENEYNFGDPYAFEGESEDEDRNENRINRVKKIITYFYQIIDLSNIRFVKAATGDFFLLLFFSL